MLLQIKSQKSYRRCEKKLTLSRSCLSWTNIFMRSMSCCCCWLSRSVSDVFGGKRGLSRFDYKHTAITKYKTSRQSRIFDHSIGNSPNDCRVGPNKSYLSFKYPKMVDDIDDIQVEIERSGCFIDAGVLEKFRFDLLQPKKRGRSKKKNK